MTRYTCLEVPGKWGRPESRGPLENCPALGPPLRRMPHPHHYDEVIFGSTSILHPWPSLERDSTVGSPWI